MPAIVKPKRTHHTEVRTTLSSQFAATHIASYSYSFSSRYNAPFLGRDSVTFAHWNAKPVKHRIEICEIQVRKARVQFSQLFPNVLGQIA